MSNIDNIHVLVHEQLLEELVTNFKDFSDVLQNSIDEYLVIMKDLKTNGIISGEISVALSTFIKYAEVLDECFEKMGNTLSNEIKNYLSDVDAKDTFLY